MKVSFDTKSIKQAIREYQMVRRQIVQLQQRFFVKCYKWFTQRANKYLSESTIGDNVKNEIANGWTYTLYENAIRITNTAEKAVFVEFGAGAKGETKPHPNANNEGYQYNIPTEFKHAGEYHLNPDTWRFIVNDMEDVDLRIEDVESWGRASGDYKIITTGSVGAMYAHNALMDLKLEYPNIWEQVKVQG